MGKIKLLVLCWLGFAFDWLLLGAAGLGARAVAPEVGLYKLLFGVSIVDGFFAVVTAALLPLACVVVFFRWLVRDERRKGIPYGAGVP